MFFHQRSALVLAGLVALAAGPQARAQRASPTLQTLGPFSALPQTRTTPQKPVLSNHAGPWGVFDQLDGSPAGFGPVSRWGTSRWAEDWSALRDRRRRDDPLDALKFIPLDRDGDIYLTLSGESRLRNWYESRPFLGRQTPHHSGRMALRNLLGADLHLGEHLRVYGELINGDAFGWNYYGYNATYRTRLDVQQLFAEFRARLAGARTGLMVGRQQFLDAPNYVLFARETPNVPLSWNGVRAYAIWPRFRIDGFDFVQTNINPPAMFHDTENWTNRLFGAVTSYALPKFRFLGAPGQVFFDSFWLGYVVGGANATVASASGTRTNTTHRDNLGGRLWGRAGPVEFSLGGLFQGGQINIPASSISRRMHAYAANGFVGYRFAGTYGRPMLGVQSDIYSGGNAHDRYGSTGTYLAPYNPQTNYLDTTAYLAPQNLVDVTPTFEVTPLSNTLLRLRLPFFWRASTNDAIYGPGRVYSFPRPFSGGYVGTIPQANFAIRFSRHLTWTHDIAGVLLSSSLRRPGAQDGFYYQSTLGLRF